MDGDANFEACAGRDAGVDLLPPLNLRKSAGKVVLECLEVGRSCLHLYATSFAKDAKKRRIARFW